MSEDIRKDVTVLSQIARRNIVNVFSMGCFAHSFVNALIVKTTVIINILPQ